MKTDPADPQGVVPDYEWVKQGRAEAIGDLAKQRIFLDAALDPLLQVSQQNADAIYAWELINEPDWITNTWHPNGKNDHPIDSHAMERFFDNGAGRTAHAGFRPTIGFALVETLLASGITVDVNQFHHYPGGTRMLPPQLFDEQSAAIVGEFATAANDVWPELGIHGQRVNERRQLAVTDPHNTPMLRRLWALAASIRPASGFAPSLKLKLWSTISFAVGVSMNRVPHVWAYRFTSLTPIARAWTSYLICQCAVEVPRATKVVSRLGSSWR